MSLEREKCAIGLQKRRGQRPPDNGPSGFYVGGIQARACGRTSLNAFREDRCARMRVAGPRNRARFTPVFRLWLRAKISRGSRGPGLAARAPPGRGPWRERGAACPRCPRRIYRATRFDPVMHDADTVDRYACSRCTFML